MLFKTKPPLMPLEISFLYSQHLAYSAVKITIWFVSALLLLCHFHSYCSCSAIFLNKYPVKYALNVYVVFIKEVRTEISVWRRAWRLSCLLRPSYIYIISCYTLFSIFSLVGFCLQLYSEMALVYHALSFHLSLWWCFHAAWWRIIAWNMNANTASVTPSSFIAGQATTPP